jgi:uncharacterized protein
LPVTLPSPEYFYAGPLQSFAASVSIPLKILVGNQTGERASSEDSEEWDQTCMGRRTDVTHPLILSLVERFVRFKVLPDGKDWFVDQADLTEAKTSEKVERASKMSAINTQSVTAAGQLTFTVDEIREAMDYEPVAPALLETDVNDEPEDTGDDKQSED